MKALLIVDMQNDFMSGGALPVPHGEEIVPFINDLEEKFELIVASKDWHPPDHISFELWPPHCVQNTWGAEFVPSLNTSKISHVVYKGSDPAIDSYSAFSTGLGGYLKERGVDELYVVGVATDFCVKYSALDARNLGFQVTVLIEGCRGIGDTEKVLKEIGSKGVAVLSTRATGMPLN